MGRRQGRTDRGGEGVTTAADIVRGLNGHWHGRYAMCRCPAHQDGTPSLSVSETRDKRPLVKCHAGCDQRAVIDALRLRDLWPSGRLVSDPAAPQHLTVEPDGLDDEERKQREKARALWKQRRKIQGTQAEAYLRARAITDKLPDCLGFIPEVPFWYTPKPPEGERPRPICLGHWPAMIAALQTDHDVLAVQLTYLERGVPRKAEIIAPDTGEVLKVKKVRGPMEDSAIRLRAPLETLGLAEGIETALSADQMYCIPTWAVTSVTRLSLVAIPDGVREIVVFRDAFKPGPKGAAATSAVKRAWDRYDSEGYKTMIVGPDEPHDDMNAWLQAGFGRAA